jgi:hypothetical protein
MLDRFARHNLLTLNDTDYRIGAGGLGYTDALLQPDCDPEHVPARDLRGSGAAQLFANVSPRMHLEFALQYEVRRMSGFGRNYYGCCDRSYRKTSGIVTRRDMSWRQVSARRRHMGASWK